MYGQETAILQRRSYKLRRTKKKPCMCGIKFSIYLIAELSNS